MKVWLRLMWRLVVRVGVGWWLEGKVRVRLGRVVWGLDVRGEMNDEGVELLMGRVVVWLGYGEVEEGKDMLVFEWGDRVCWEVVLGLGMNGLMGIGWMVKLKVVGVGG